MGVIPHAPADSSGFAITKRQNQLSPPERIGVASGLGSLVGVAALILIFFIVRRLLKWRKRRSSAKNPNPNPVPRGDSDTVALDNLHGNENVDPAGKPVTPSVTSHGSEATRVHGNDGANNPPSVVQ